MNADGTNLVRLTHGTSPDWSPDGKKIAYTGYVKETNTEKYSAPGSAEPQPFVENPYIFVMNTDGSGQTKLLDRTATDPVWSPDGKEIAFFLYSATKGYDPGYAYCGIYIMDADGSGKPRRLAPGPGCAYSPAWSPDGNNIAYSGGHGLGYEDYKQDIYVANASEDDDHTNQPRALTDYASGGASEPSWSPDGNEIAFIYKDRTTTKTSIYKMDADGSGKTPLLEVASPIQISPSWSPDGRQIAYVSVSSIYIMNSDGSNLSLVRSFEGGGNVWGLDWKPPS